MGKEMRSACGPAMFAPPLQDFSELLLKISTCAKKMARLAPQKSYIFDISASTQSKSGEKRAKSSHKRKFLATTLEIHVTGSLSVEQL